MIVVRSCAELRGILASWRTQGERIAFVPTMGNLHAGHLHLVETAKNEADRVVVSIFVNPTQFCEGEDLEAYPRTPEQDIEKLESKHTDLLFMPEAGEIYPTDKNRMTFVEVPDLSDELCGRFRPGHFRGVATIVCKLLNRVQPDIALFGEKDYQQLTLIRKMVDDLDMPVRIQGVPTVREPSGLAMSSRNGYMSPQEKDLAATIYLTLSLAVTAVQSGERHYRAIERNSVQTLESAGFSVDYVSIRRQQDLESPTISDNALVVLAAAHLGRTHLIDNIAFSLEASPS